MQDAISPGNTRTVGRGQRRWGETGVAFEGRISDTSGPSLPLLSRFGFVTLVSLVRINFRERFVVAVEFVRGDLAGTKIARRDLYEISAAGKKRRRYRLARDYISLLRDREARRLRQDDDRSNR